MNHFISPSAGQDEVDRILAHDDEMLPSSGFAASVMDAVRREATAPPPIPFPWKRALPGLVVAVLAVAAIVVGIVITMARVGTSPTVSTPLPLGIEGLHMGAGVQSAVLWTGVALLLTLASVKVSMRLGSSST